VFWSAHLHENASQKLPQWTIPVIDIIRPRSMSHITTRLDIRYTNKHESTINKCNQSTERFKSIESSEWRGCWDLGADGLLSSVHAAQARCTDLNDADCRRRQSCNIPQAFGFRYTLYSCPLRRPLKR